VPDLHTTMAPEFWLAQRSNRTMMGKPGRNQTWDDIPAASGGCVPGIPMVQSADARHGHDSGPCRGSSFDRSWGGRVFVQRIVDAVLMIVAEIFQAVVGCSVALKWRIRLGLWLITKKSKAHGRLRSAP
jgi:hypothetical protein